MSRGGIKPGTLAAEFLETLRNVRIARQINVYAFAERVGFDQAGIRRWESGESSPLLINFITYADALGYDVKLIRREPNADT